MARTKIALLRNASSRPLVQLQRMKNGKIPAMTVNRRSKALPCLDEQLVAMKKEEFEHYTFLKFGIPELLRYQTKADTVSQMGPRLLSVDFF